MITRSIVTGVGQSTSTAGQSTNSGGSGGDSRNRNSDRDRNRNRNRDRWRWRRDGINRTSISDDDRALSSLAGFAILLMVITAAYSYFQVYGVPQTCAAYEIKHFSKVVDELCDLTAKVEEVVRTGNGQSQAAELGGSYPEIPFFSTPPGFAGSLTSYDAEVRILNAIAIDSDVREVWDGVNNPVWKGASLLYEPVAIYGPSQQARWEYGVVAVGKLNFSAVSSFKIIDGKEIRVPLLRGNISESGASTTLSLSPYSGGGRGIAITDNGNPITIELKTSLPLEFWKDYFNSLNSPYVTSVNEFSGYVVITLSRGITYYLVGGAAALVPEKAPQHYLYRLTPNSTTPATLAVEVRDDFNNPVPGINVTFEVIGGSVTLTDGANTGSALTVRSNCGGIAAVIASSGSGSVKASITRPDGSTFDVVFYVR